MERESQSLHQRMEKLTGADVRLFYGLLVPMSIVVVLIIALALSPTWWLLVPLVLVLLAVTGIVMTGFLQMLNGDE